MLRQSLAQKLLQKLSPQQIQLMKLLQIPTANLEQRIKEELEANPALEEGDAIDNVIEDLEESSEFENEYEEDKKDANDDYEAKRFKDMALQPPRSSFC